MSFFNSLQKDLSFADVVACIKYFIKTNPDGAYRIAVGTDSQVKGSYTCFATGIHVHRVGQGAWCCISRRIDNKLYESLKDKISRETEITQEMVNALKESLIDALCDFTVKYENFDCRLEAQIDMGTKGEMRKLIRKMAGQSRGAGGDDAKIRPDAFAASGCPSRHSKKIKVG